MDLVTRFVGADGAIESRTDSLKGELERIQESRVNLEERITSYRQRLVDQFSAADALISSLTAPGIT